MYLVPDPNTDYEPISILCSHCHVSYL